MVSCLSGTMPTAVSCTVTCSRDLCGFPTLGSVLLTPTTISPWLLNLMALLTKFTRICRSRIRSPMKPVQDLGSQISEQFEPFLVATLAQTKLDLFQVESSLRLNLGKI